MSIVTQGIRELVKKSIADNQVMIFSKSYCPFCKKAKSLFNDIQVDYKALELDQHLDGEAIQAALAELTNQKTVPNIFINQQHIGGSDALTAAFKSGKLAQILKEAHIEAKL